MSTSRILAWLPDWKDAGAYEKPRDEWFVKNMIWEFLRRNTEYQADYKRFADLPDLRPGGGKTAKIYNQGMMLTDDMSFRYCEPPALLGETWEQYQFRVGDHVIEDRPLIEHLMEKWCITCIVDPKENDGVAMINAYVDMPPYELHIDKAIDEFGYVSRKPSPDEPEHVTLRFDLRYGIDEQLKRAKEVLLLRKDYLENGPLPYQLNKEQSKDHKNKFPIYLRAFDAAAAAATFLEIGETLFHRKSDVTQMIAAAFHAADKGREYVDGKYKDLIRKI
ncbi:MAG: DUF6499 domain-containing protein [Nitrosospira sp.]